MAAAKADGPKKKGRKSPVRPMRHVSEKALDDSKKIPSGLTGQTPEQLIHELQVHQIELETQAEELRRTQLALEESRDKYLDLYEFAPLGYLTLNDKALIVEVNINGATLLGIDRGKLINTRFRKFIVSEDFERWDRFFIQVLKEGVKQSCTLQLTRDDKSTFSARLEGIRLTRTDGAISVRIAFSDISDIRKIEALRESEEKKYRDLYRNSALGIFHSTFNGRFIDVNPALAKLLGYDSPEMVVASVTNIAEQVYYEPPQYDAVATTALHAGGFLSRENRYRRRDGTLWYGKLHLRIVPDSSGNSRYYEGFVEDITDRVRAEEALKDSEEKFRTLFENAGDAIFIMNSTVFTECNQSTERIFGCTRDQIIGHSPLEFSPEQQPDGRLSSEKAQEMIEAALSGEPQLFEWVHRHADGTPFDAEVTLNRIPRMGVPYLQAVVRDITAHHTAKQALRESEIRFREQYQNNPLAIFTWQYRDGDFVLVDCNKAADILTSGRSNDYLGKKASEMYSTRSQIISQVGKCFSEQGRLSMERISEHFLPGRLIHTTASFVPPDLIMVHMEDITERRKAEDALRESEEKYRLIADNTADNIWIFDMEFQTKYVSPSIKKMRGFTVEEAMALRLDQQMTPVSIAGVMKKFNEEMELEATGTADPHRTVSFETEEYCKDGSTIRVENSVALLRDADGHPYGILGISRDITERKQTEEALKKAYGLLNETQELSHIGGWEFDVATGRITWTDEVYRIHGVGFDFDPGAFHRDMQFYTPRDKPVIEKAFQHCREQGEAYDLEVELVRLDGRRIWVRTIGKPVVADGRIVRLHGTIIDITRRRETEDAIRTSEEKYRLLFTSMIEGSALHELVYDASGTCSDYRILDVNPAYERIIGLKRQDIIGKTSCEVYGVDTPPYFEVYFRVASTGMPEEFEVYFEPQNKHFTISAYSPKKGRFATIFEDITSRKQSEEIRERYSNDLARKNAELDRFTYTISHDLKSPLIAIRGFLGLLEKDMQTGNSERVQKDIFRISESAEKLEHMITTLLSLSRSGKAVDAPLRIPFADIVREAAGLLDATVWERNGALVIPDALPFVYGDRQRLVQAMMNLLDNAAKFMGNQKEPRIEVGVQEDACTPVFFVKDNGMGIARENLSKVFGLYERFNPEFPGTGIGLATVKRIVEAHDGRIWVESEGEGMGTTFRFTLPVTDGQHR